MEKLLLTETIPTGYDNINSLQLRADIEHAYIGNGNETDGRLQGFYLTPKGSISGDEESFAIDLEDEDGNPYESYLYSSGYEYTQDVVTLGLDIYTVDYDKKVLSIYWGGELFVRELNEGDVGDFWHTLRSDIDNDIEKDINFHQEDEEQEPTLALYGIKVEDGLKEIDTSDEYLIENYIQVGNPEKYFGSDMIPENPKKVTLHTPYHVLQMVQIPEGDLLSSVVELLNGRESFKDADETLKERIYSGDVFQEILYESQPKDAETFEQLRELNEGSVDMEYIQVITI